MDLNGKATSVTRYDKQGNAVGTQNYDDGKTPPSKTPSFTDVIATIYEKGKQVASKLFSMKFFDVAPTPKFMKELGLSGDKFTIKYGVISRHIGKDGSHDLSQEDWDKLPQALQNPFAIARLTDKDNAYRIYTSLQTSNGEYIVVGVDVKNAGREIEVNSISTVFGRRDNANLPKNEEVIYMSKEITPEQSALLKRPNFSQYPTDEELSDNKGSKKNDKTKIPVQKRRVTYFAKEDKELGEYFNFYDFVLRKIATGQIAFIWEDKANGTKGLGSHLGLSKSNKERNKRIWMLSNEEGLYPEVAAEALLSQYAEEAFGQTEGLPEEITGMTTMDAFNTLMDVLHSYDTRNSMMQAAIELHNTGETEYLANLEQEQEPETINNQDTQGGLGNPLGEERNEVPFRQGEQEQASKVEPETKPKAESKGFTLSEQHKKELQAEATRRMNALRKAGKEFRAELNNNPDIVIVDKASDLPKEAFDAMSDEDKIASAFAKGWYSHNGKTYIILSNTSTANTSNAEDLKATLFHEAVAHKGLRELIGKDNFNRLCQAVYDAMPEKERERIRFEENYARGYIDEKGETFVESVPFVKAEDVANREGVNFRLDDIEEVNKRFNKELQQQIDGTLTKGHIYQLGMPSKILRSCGFPDMPIELSSTNLAEHARKTHHPFELEDVKDIVRALQSPIAVFSYGDKVKSQNVIVEIQKEDRNFLVGVHFNQNRRGLIVSDIRGIFPKDNAEWLNWISQGKSLYLNKEKIQALIDKQRKTLAEVEYLDLNSVTKVIKDFENPTLEAEKNTENISFRLSSQSDATLSRIEQESSKTYEEITKIELPKAETPIEIAKNKQTERTLFRFDKDFASMIALQNAIKEIDIARYNTQGINYFTTLLINSYICCIFTQYLKMQQWIT